MLSNTPPRPLSTPYPGPTALTKTQPDPVAERMIAGINNLVRAIRRNKLVAQTSAQRIIECECELTALTRNAETLGLRLEIDPDTGLRKIYRGDAGRTDEVVAP